MPTTVVRTIKTAYEHSVLIILLQGIMVYSINIAVISLDNEMRLYL